MSCVLCTCLTRALASCREMEGAGDAMMVAPRQLRKALSTVSGASPSNPEMAARWFCSTLTAGFAAGKGATGTTRRPVRPPQRSPSDKLLSFDVIPSWTILWEDGGYCSQQKGRSRVLEPHNRELGPRKGRVRAPVDKIVPLYS